MKRALQILKEQAGRFVDAVSDLTGYDAVRVPLQRATRPGEVTLALPGYRQINSYACGAVAAAMAVKFLRPQMSFERIHAAVNPCPEIGAGTGRVVRALRSLGLGVSRRTRVTFDDLCAAIKAGRPVLACVTTTDPYTTHWVVIYGYGRRPKQLFVAGEGLPFLARQRMAWPEFRQRWSPAGEAIVCQKTKPRKIVPPKRAIGSK